MDKEQIKAISESIPMEQRFSVEQIVSAAIESYKAELLKEVGEPVACVDKRDWDWHLVNSPETSLGIWPTSDWKRKLNLPYQVPMFFYTSDQVASAVAKATKPLEDQLAKAEQRVAEACALQVATETKFHWLDAARVAKEIRSGEWRKFVKEV